MADFTIFELLLLQFFLIFLNAVFACAEIAIISVNETKLRRLADNGDKRAYRLIYFMEQPAQFLATIQVCITFSGFLGSAFAADNFSDKIVDWLIASGLTISAQKLDVFAVIAITLILSYVTLILGELVPKRIAMKYAERIGLSMSGMIYIIAKLFAPLVWLLTISTNTILKLLKINPKDEKENVTEEEIRIMIDAGSENGTIDDMEKEIIHNVFEFDDKIVERIMTHRTDIVFLNTEDSKTDWEKTMIATRFSVYPVCNKDLEGIIGILSIKDYFKFQHNTKEFIIKNAVKPVQFFHEATHIDDLFHVMQKSRTHFAVIIDEYGAVDGIATMNDLLEEIVGELEDDVTAPPCLPLIVKNSDTSWTIKGITPIEDVEKELNIDIPEGEYDTLAGFLLSLTNEFPTNKKQVFLKYLDFDIKITRIVKRKIEEVEISQRED